MQNSWGKITPLHESDVPKGISGYKHSSKEVSINCRIFKLELRNSYGKITPFNENDISLGITFLNISIVKKKFWLTVLYLIYRLQNSQGKSAPFFENG